MAPGVGVPAVTAPGKTPGGGPGRVAAPRRARPSLAVRLGRAASRGPLHVVLLVVALVWLLPTLGLLVASMRTPGQNAVSGWWNAVAHPSELSVENYRQLLGNERIIDSFWNTVLIAVPATVLVVAVGALAGYAFAWISFPGRDWLFLGVIALLVVPLQVALIPVAELFGELGLFGTITGVVLFHTAFGLPFAIFLLRNFFAGIPRELLEAARIDGAGELRVFLRVVLPIGVPALASLAIFQFLWTWNDLLVGLVFAGSDAAPLTVAIREQTRQFGANIDIIAPGAFLSMVVPLIVFFAFQRYFVQGLLAGAER